MKTIIPALVFLLFPTILGQPLLWAQNPKNQAPAVEVVQLAQGGQIRGLLLGRSPKGNIWLVTQRQWLKKANPELFSQFEEEETDRNKKIRTNLARRVKDWLDSLGGDQESLKSWLQDELKNWQADEPAKTGQLMLLSLNPKQIKKVESRSPPIRQLIMLALQERVQGLEDRTPIDLIKDLKSLGLEPGRDRPNILDRVPPFPVEDESDWLARKALMTYQMGKVLQLQGSGDFLVEQPKPGAANGANGMEGLLTQMLPKLLTKAFGEILGDPTPVAAWQPKAIQMAEAARVDMVRVIRVEPDLANRKMIVEDTILGRTTPGQWGIVWQTRLLADGNQARPAAEAVIKSDPQIAPLLKAAAALGADAQVNEAIRFGAATMELQQEANQKFGQFLKLSTRRLDGIPLKWLLDS